MKRHNSLLALLFTVIFLSACDMQPLTSDCPDADIRWMDTLMINNVHYEHHSPDLPDENTSYAIEKGKKIGEVSFKMADRACSNHKMKNGDATYLEKGTPIYKIKDYPASFVVLANNKVYVADKNKEANTAQDLYPLDGFVKDIHIESLEDGRRLLTFSASSKAEFVKVWKQLKLEDRTKLNQPNRNVGEEIFLEIELTIGPSFRLVYWGESNTFSDGVIGNKALKDIIETELSKLNQP